MSDNKNQYVQLKKKSAKNRKPGSRKFPIAQANVILKLPNSQWELDDNGYKWNGTELSVNSKK